MPFSGFPALVGDGFKGRFKSDQTDFFFASLTVRVAVWGNGALAGRSELAVLCSLNCSMKHSTGREFSVLLFKQGNFLPFALL